MPIWWEWKVVEGRKLARSRGFEPLTAWFVARYSIQLSYERVKVTNSNNSEINCNPELVAARSDARGKEIITVGGYRTIER